MSDLDTITEVTIVSRFEGENETIAATKRVGANLDKLTNANENLAQSETRVAAAGDRTNRYRISAAAAAERLQRQLDNEYRARRQMEAAQRDLERARQQGVITAAREAELLRLATERYGTAAVGMRSAAAANDNLARSTQISAHHLTNLGYQLQDITVSLAGGQSPFMVLLQQGSQIAPILGETGVSGAIRGVGSAIGRFITPATATVALLSGAVIYGYSTWSRYDDEQRKVGATLQGLGRNVGLTKAQFEDLASAAAAAGSITTRQASSIATALAATGKIDPDNIRRITALSKDFAATFGGDLDSIKEKLESTFKDFGGIDRLNDDLQFLDARTRRTIQSLFDAGKAQDAIRLAVEKLPPALAKSEEAQGAGTRAWKAITSAVSEADLATGKFLDRLVKGPAPDERLKQLQQRVEMLKQAEAENLVQPGGTSRTFVPPTAPTVASTTSTPLPPSRPSELQEARSELQKYMEKLAETRRQEEAVAEQKALEESLNRKSNQLRDIVKEVGSGSDEWLRYRDLQTAVDDALRSGNPELMKRVDSVKDLSEAQGVLEQVTKSTTNAQGERMTAAERAQRSNAAEVAGIRARTVEERARVASMQAVERQRGQMITGAQAQADAEHAAQMVREQSAAQLRDTLRDQQLEAEEIRKKIALLGQDSETRTVVMARQKEEQNLTRQGIDLHSDLAQRVLAGAEANARLGASYDRAVEAQQRMRDGQREIASEFSSFFEDVLIGSRKFGDAFASLTKTLASNTLRAALTGEGPMAALMGTMPNERGQIGGLLGGALGAGGLFDFGAIEKAVFGGTSTGVTDAFSELLKFQKQGGLATSRLGGALMPAVAGGAIGYASQSPIAGALGGGLAGFSSANDDDQQEDAA